MTASLLHQSSAALGADPPSPTKAATALRLGDIGDIGERQIAEISSALLPTSFGNFQITIVVDINGREHVVLRLGNPAATGRPALVRVHSECLTSEVFGSLLCDCREQLHGALSQIARLGSGLLIYLRQEGRNIGLANKIRAYALQQEGFDTVDANLQLGLPVDNRTFHIAAEMLRHEGVTSVRLITNNPQKVADLEAAGIEVVERVPLSCQTRQENFRYLETKRERLGHFFDAPLSTGR